MAKSQLRRLMERATAAPWPMRPDRDFNWCGHYSDETSCES
jgi:hypothetical protein